MIRHIAGLAEIVEDVDAALVFYRDVLGLTVEKHDGDDYAMLSVPGVLHFGLWNRGHAAEAVFGSREDADRIPLGFTLEFEADDVADAARRLEEAGQQISQAPREEPWGQKTFRMLSPGGSLLGFAETPWARSLTQHMETSDGDASQNHP